MEGASNENLKVICQLKSQNIGNKPKYKKNIGILEDFKKKEIVPKYMKIKSTL